MRPKAWLSWSSGKDSAWSLHVLRQQAEVDVVGLLTTVNQTHERVAMHAVRRSLLRLQAAAAGLPVVEVDIPSPCTNDQYEAAMQRACERAVGEGVTVIAFGDLFLEDIRAYREEKLAGTGLRPIFPLWGRPTPALAREMIAGGLRAKITCVDPRHLDASFAGGEFADVTLPATVDPCGERGEFHTFAWAGPMFAHDVAVTVGEVVHRDGFVFADLTPDAVTA